MSDNQRGSTSPWRVSTAGYTQAATLAQLEGLAFEGRSWGADSVKASFGAPGVTVLFGASPPLPPQGFAVWRALGEEAEMLTIGVTPDARGRGLGAALLEAATEGARGIGAARFFLEVAAENDKAIALYRRAGFEQVGRRARYYRDGGDAAVMAKYL